MKSSEWTLNLYELSSIHAPYTHLMMVENEEREHVISIGTSPALFDVCVERVLEVCGAYQIDPLFGEIYPNGENHCDS